MKLIYLLLVTTLLIPASPLMAKGGKGNSETLKQDQDKGYEWGEKRQRRFKLRERRWLKRLDLDTEQAKAVKEIRDKYEPDLEAVRDEMHASKKAFHELAINKIETFDDAFVEELRQHRKKIQDLHQKMDDISFEIMTQTMKVLKPEQRKKFGLRFFHRMGGRKHLRGGPRGRGGPEGEGFGRGRHKRGKRWQNRE